MNNRRNLSWTVFLTALWVLLNGELSVANVLGGLAVSAVVLLTFPIRANDARHRVHLGPMIGFALFVAWNLIASSWAVAKTVINPTPVRLRAGIVRCELPGASPLIVTLVSNAITLTPGTLTISAQIDPAEIAVHGLGLGDVEEFRASVAALQKRATAAFTPQTPRAGS